MKHLGCCAAVAALAACSGSGSGGSGTPPPDTTPPQISITSPADSSRLSGTAIVEASASDDVGVTSVLFRLDGADLGAPLLAPPWRTDWDTTSVADGAHVLTAVATDGALNTTESDPVGVDVFNATVDTTPPEISITQPTGSSRLSGTTILEASATDNVGVTSVVFRLDGADLGTPISNPPWRTAWDTTTVADGAHVLTAVATDGALNTTESDPVDVNVSNVTVDTTPPSISIVTPANQSVLAGSTVIAAAAQDDVGVVSVVFRVDGTDLGPPVTTPPWRTVWDTASAADGTHFLTAVALDAASNPGESQPVRVEVLNASTPTLDISTLLGSQDQDTARDVFVDVAGFVYVTGGTASAGFPTTPGAYDRTFNGTHDVFVAKFGPDGALIYSTFVGGPNYDRAYAIEADAQGFVTIAGRAGDGFPTTPGALQTTFGGDTQPSTLYGAQDGFVARLAPDGASLVWSTYFGGDGPDAPRDMAIDAAGNAYVAEGVLGPFPYVTPGAFDTSFSGVTDGLVAAIAADGTHVLWCSYYGGSGSDGGTPSLRVSPNGTVWVLGHTQSNDFPVTSGAYQTMRGGGVDLVLLEVAAGGASLEYATYFGGSADDFTETHGLWVEPSGEAIIAATTNSPDLPFVAASIPPPFQPSFGGLGGPGTGAATNYPGDGFIARISSNGRQLLAFTYVGGSQGEGIEGVAVDSQGRVSVAGATYSSNFPVTSAAFQPVKSGGADALVARFSADLTALEFGSFFGGSGEDLGRSVADGANGRTVYVGMTASPNYPVTPGAFDTSYGGGSYDAFVIEIEY